MQVPTDPINVQSVEQLPPQKGAVPRRSPAAYPFSWHHASHAGVEYKTVVELASVTRKSDPSKIIVTRSVMI